MKYKFKLESKPVHGAAGGGTWSMPFERNIQVYTFFYDVLWYVMKLRIS